MQQKSKEQQQKERVPSLDTTSSDAVSISSIGSINKCTIQTKNDETSSSTRKSPSSLVGLVHSFTQNIIREVEARKQAKRDALVADCRRRSRDRMRARPFLPSQQKRLQELKAARKMAGCDHHQEQKKRASDNDDTGDTTTAFFAIMKQSWTHMLSNQPLHGSFKQKMFGIFLFVTFFLLQSVGSRHLLNDLVEPAWGNATTSWPMRLVLDLGTLLYMVVCAVLHLLFIDLLLLNTFEAMELGNKVGQSIKQFYGHNTRQVVTSFSFGILAVSIGWALLKIAVRASLLWISRIYFSAVETMIAAVNVLMKETLPYFLGVVVLPESFHSSDNNVGSTYMSLSPRSSSVVETTDVIVSWRSDSITISCVLLSYSLVFMSVLAILIQFFAKQQQQQRAHTKSIKKSQSSTSNNTTSVVAAAATGEDVHHL